MKYFLLIALVGLSQQIYRVANNGYSGVNNAEQVQQTAARSPRNNPVDYTAAGSSGPARTAGPASPNQVRPAPNQVGPTANQVRPATNQAGPTANQVRPAANQVGPTANQVRPTGNQGTPAAYQVRPPPSQVAAATSQFGSVAQPNTNAGSNTQNVRYNSVKPFSFPRGTYLPSDSERGSVVGNGEGATDVGQTNGQGGAQVAAATAAQTSDQNSPSIAAILIPDQNSSPNGGIGSRMVGRPIDKATLTQLTNGQEGTDDDDDVSGGLIYIIDFNSFMSNAAAQGGAPAPISASPAAATGTTPQLNGGYSAILIPNLGRAARRHRQRKN